jgi:hypothetical protein
LSYDSLPVLGALASKLLPAVNNLNALSIAALPAVIGWSVRTRSPAVARYVLLFAT